MLKLSRTDYQLFTGMGIAAAMLSLGVAYEVRPEWFKPDGKASPYVYDDVQFAIATCPELAPAISKALKDRVITNSEAADLRKSASELGKKLYLDQIELAHQRADNITKGTPITIKESQCVVRRSGHRYSRDLFSNG
jgi:hypothetical protein